MARVFNSTFNLEPQFRTKSFVDHVRGTHSAHCQRPLTRAGREKKGREALGGMLAKGGHMHPLLVHGVFRCVRCCAPAPPEPEV